MLGLTGAEISINNLPAGAGVPFVHSHKKNEEISYNHADVWIMGSMYVILASATIAGGRIMAKGKTEMPHLMRNFTGETDDEHALARTDCRSRMHA